MVMVIIAILTVMLEEGYLADICIIYAMISFLAVIVLTKVYMGVYQEKKQREERETWRSFEWIRLLGRRRLSALWPWHFS